MVHNVVRHRRRAAELDLAAAPAADGWLGSLVLGHAVAAAVAVLAVNYSNDRPEGFVDAAHFDCPTPERHFPLAQAVAEHDSATLRPVRQRGLQLGFDVAAAQPEPGLGPEPEPEPVVVG